jgi:hypothetical protein
MDRFGAPNGRLPVGPACYAVPRPRAARRTRRGGCEGHGRRLAVRFGAAGASGHAARLRRVPLRRSSSRWPHLHVGLCADGCSGARRPAEPGSPRLLASVGPATQIGAAKHQSAVVGVDGVVWFFGWDGCATSTAQRTPARLPHTHSGGGRVTAVGGGHIAALTASDGVVCYGGGALFAGLLSSVAVVAIAAGAFHTAAPTASGEVYTWAHPRPVAPAGLALPTRAGAGGPFHRPQPLPPTPPPPPPLPPQPVCSRWLRGAECVACAGDYTAAARAVAGGGSLVRWERQSAGGGGAGGSGVRGARNGTTRAGAGGGDGVAAGSAVTPFGGAAAAATSDGALGVVRGESTSACLVSSLVGGGGYFFA